MHLPANRAPGHQGTVSVNTPGPRGNQDSSLRTGWHTGPSCRHQSEFQVSSRRAFTGAHCRDHTWSAGTVSDPRAVTGAAPSSRGPCDRDALMDTRRGPLPAAAALQHVVLGPRLLPRMRHPHCCDARQEPQRPRSRARRACAERHVRAGRALSQPRDGRAGFPAASIFYLCLNLNPQFSFERKRFIPHSGTHLQMFPGEMLG